MAPGYTLDEMGFQQPRQALGHHRAWGAVTWCCWISLSTAESAYNLGRRSSKERPSQGSAAAVVTVTDFTGWKGQRWIWVGQATLPLRSCTHTRMHTHTHTHTPQEKQAPCPALWAPARLLACGFWGRLDQATKKLSFLLIKQAHQVPPFLNKTSESKTRNKTWAELRSAVGERKKWDSSVHAGRRAHFRKQN